MDQPRIAIETASDRITVVYLCEYDEAGTKLSQIRIACSADPIEALTKAANMGGHVYAQCSDMQKRAFEEKVEKQKQDRLSDDVAKGAKEMGKKSKIEKRSHEDNEEPTTDGE